ncbi:protein Dok-7-like [Thalassophryne amazonica]|uniref:protein Dok-7-like n=1 Tax=Thalassophryne amazonica TaxID=390379 RepID=UPI0014710244|nr:protein Dok-7-like [Thalassophryne amazonica]
MTDSVVVEGYARLRDGKKGVLCRSGYDRSHSERTPVPKKKFVSLAFLPQWKTRWLVLRKPSPVADCLVLLVFKDKSDKSQGIKERVSVTLEEICGVETGQWYEGVALTLAILCLNQVAVLGFDTSEALQAWDARLRYSLGEVHRFSVGVLPGTRLESGPATLHLCNNLLSLIRDIPPVIIGHWNLPDLRRYGPIPNGFVFEGGTRCGYWAGVFLLASAESEQISFLFDCIVRGISPTRGPFGLRPVLPDPGASQMKLEERLNQEAQELEKRLSMLSCQSSAVLSTSCVSAGGDNLSTSGSSDTSDTNRSDCSIGSRLAIWTEPASTPNKNTVSPQSTEKLSVNQADGNPPPSTTPRWLQEIGRQSSSDSGIATGSHSSYLDSLSSYTGSLDTTPGEDFGSIISLPSHLAQDLGPCTCPSVAGHEYQVPTSLRYICDARRSLLQDECVDMGSSISPKDALIRKNLMLESAGIKTNASEDHSESAENSQSPSEDTKKSKMAFSSDSPHPDSSHICSLLTSASKTILTICSTCGGFKATEQSVDKLLCRSSTYGECKMFAAKTFLETCKPPEAGHGGSEVRGESSLPNNGCEKLSSLLADLQRDHSPAVQPEAKTNTLSVYESMSSAFGSELRCAPPGAYVSLHAILRQDKKAAIYENCLKCRDKHFHLPPRVFPSQTYPSGSSSTLQTEEPNCAVFDQMVPADLLQKKSPEHEEVLCHVCSPGSHTVDGHPEEINMHSVKCEEKGCNDEERRKADLAYKHLESTASESNSETEERRKHELMIGCGQQRLFREAEEAPLPEKPRGDCVTYVNIPISPTSKKQVNYLELELHEPVSHGTATHLPAQRKSCTKYAQIDIAVTETARKVGSRHVLGRQEGLHTLERRRKGVPH